MAGCSVAPEYLATARTSELIERADAEFLAARLQALAASGSNPYGAGVRRSGNAYAFMMREIPSPYFNLVMGVDETSLDAFDGFADWYRAEQVPLRADIAPHQASPAVFAALTRHGLGQTGFYTGLYGPPVAHSPDSVVRVSPADADEFADVYVSGFGFHADYRDAMADSLTVLADRPHTQFFRAMIGDQVAGVGLLFVTDRVGYLNLGTTLPRFRRHGVHGALVRARISAAHAAGCELVVGQATVNGGGQRTMERCGLRVAYTKAVWTTPEHARTGDW
jgi:GNAT superfamily N-acetyltransferase